MIIVPITLREANNFVANFHRHNKKVQGCKFVIGASDELLGLIGVAIIGRPVARQLQDGYTAEITRCCVRPDAPKNTCSFLYGASRRIWQAMGGKRLITYTLQSESGTSLRAVGCSLPVSVAPHKGWGSRPNREWQPVYGQLKFRWDLIPVDED